MIVKIIPIKYNSRFDKLKKENFKHKFLYESVSDKITYYNDKENKNIEVYSLFDFHFLVIKSEEKETAENKNCYGFMELSKNENYTAYYFNTVQTDEEISKMLRNSNTLKVSNQNCYDNDDIKVVFAEKGFVLCNKFKAEAKDKFDRTIVLFILALAYNQKVEKLLQDVSTAYEKKSYEDMIRLRDEIHAFDLSCFFYNPVKQNRPQPYTQWNLISQNYDVQIKHDEIKSQVGDLAGVIELKHKAILEDNAQKSTAKLNWIMLIIAVASFLSVFKDEFKVLLGN